MGDKGNQCTIRKRMIEKRCQRCQDIEKGETEEEKEEVRVYQGRVLLLRYCNSRM